MVEIARREREKGKSVEVNNRELWVENRRWSWDKERNRWGKRQRKERNQRIKRKGREGELGKRGKVRRRRE